MTPHLLVCAYSARRSSVRVERPRWIEGRSIKAESSWDTLAVVKDPAIRFFIPLQSWWSE